MDTNHLFDLKLPCYEGPLDLLLHLVDQAQVDLRNIEIFSITQQYLVYLSLMRELNVQVTSEFLVMAATLIEMKSKLLLPKEKELGLDEEIDCGEDDPRKTLIRRLMVYKAFKEVAEFFDEKPLLGRDHFKYNVTENEAASTVELDLYELVEAFREVVLEKHFRSEEHTS